MKPFHFLIKGDRAIKNSKGYERKENLRKRVRSMIREKEDKE